MRYKMVLSYDGTDYSGYQRQPNAHTIQAAVEKAIFDMTKIETEIFAASRTDKGVHALYQVVHFDTVADIEKESWISGLNKRLPSDIRVLKIHKVKPHFHARHDSKSKVYLYKITKQEPSIFDQRFAVYVPNLDIKKMELAAQHLIGTHDFKAFAKLDTSEEKPTIRTLYTVSVKSYKTYYLFKIHGDHFLRYMVRSIMGNLIDIGLGRKQPEHIKNLLACKDRLLTSKTAPAKGLVLYHIYY